MIESETPSPNSKKSNIISETLKKVMDSANYCYDCNRCVTVCPVSQLGIFSPRSLINDLSYLTVEDALKNNDIWTCLTCGQCSIYCPMTQENAGVRIPELILELRKLYGKEQTQIENLAECETHDGIFPLIAKIMAENPAPPNKLGFLEGTGYKVASTGEIAYFIGCIPLMQDIIYYTDVNYGSIPKSIIGLLNSANITPVVLNEKCCGHDILWSKGDVDTFKKLAEYNVKLYKDAGVKTIIVSCAEGYRTWKIDYPKYVDEFDFEVLHFSEFFLRENILEHVRFPQSHDIKVTYHDACRLGRLGGRLYEAPRELIRSIPGVKLIEMQNNRDDAKCCGVSAFSCCNEYTRVLRHNRIKEAIETGAEYLIVPCVKCLTHFNCYLSEPEVGVNNESLKGKIQVIDIASFLGKLLFLL
jgi:heterodisulfide reductase subunit D